LPKLRITDLLPDIVELAAPTPKTEGFSGIYLGNGAVMTRTWGGHLLKVIGGEMIVTPHLLNLGFNEPHVTRLLTSLIQPGDTFVDVGANIGYYSVLGAFHAWPNGRVWTFEPQPRAYQLHSDNLMMNGFDVIAERHRLALSDHDGVAEMRVFEDYEATATLRDVPPDYVENTERQTGRMSQTIEVPLARLDDIMRAVPQIDVMKIDAEGYEPAIIRGAQEIIARSPTIKIVMEFVPTDIGVADAAAHLALLRSLGLSIWIIEHDGTLTPQPDDAALLQIPFADLLLLKS
jgi:FkbM family methyltransferase